MGFASEQYWEGGEAEVPGKTTGCELRTAEAGDGYAGSTILL